jgi:hypothetical protein
VQHVLGQPFRLRFTVGAKAREHVPDVLVVAVDRVWLFDVRPAGQVRAKDLPGFAAAARVADEAGWRYAVVTGWRPHVLTGVEALSSQRRPLDDALGVQRQMLAAAAAGPETFGSLVAATSLPAVSRAHLLHLLWHRRLDVDLGEPLGDAAIVRPVPESGAAR